MRSLHAVAVLLAFGIVAAARADNQKTDSGIYTAYLNSTQVPRPNPDRLDRVDLTKVKFLAKEPCSVGMSNKVEIHVRGMVAPDIDLTDDAQEVLFAGFLLGQSQFQPSSCRLHQDREPRGELRGRLVTVSLRIGDPASFTTPNHPSFEQVGFGRIWDTRADEVYGVFSDSQPDVILNYTNAPLALKKSIELDNRNARRQSDAFARQQRAEQEKRAEIAGRRKAFVQKYGVSEFVSPKQLEANVFVFKGRVVAVRGVFEKMISEHQGLFSSGETVFVVSEIPAGKFTKSKAVILVAGGVIGNTEVKLPVVGATLVPRLKFVGSASCASYDCSEFSSQQN